MHINIYHPGRWVPVPAICTHSCTQRLDRTPAACRLSTSSSTMESAGPEKPAHPAAAGIDAATEATLPRAAPWSWWLSATAASLVAVGLGGAALLVWWTLAFHKANARLWMVPTGLVLIGTPIVALLSLLASDSCRRQAPPPDAGLFAPA